MNNTLKTSLVLCDLDHLLLGTDGNLPQVLRDVMQLFNSRGGRLTVFRSARPRRYAPFWAVCAWLHRHWSAVVHWPTSLPRAPGSHCAALPDGKKPCCRSCPQPWALASHCR